MYQPREASSVRSRRSASATVSGSPLERLLRDSLSRSFRASESTFRMSHERRETGGLRHFSCGSQCPSIRVKSPALISAFAQPPVGSPSNCGSQSRPLDQSSLKTGCTLVFDESYFPPGILSQATSVRMALNQIVHPNLLRCFGLVKIPLPHAPYGQKQNVANRLRTCIKLIPSIPQT
jgi:hypothetical protein